MGTIQFVGEVPEYEIKDGNMLIKTKDWSIAMPLPAFLKGMSRASEVIAKWQVSQLDKGTVVSIGPGNRRRKH